MRCTSCSQEVKPIVVTDIDGTLCDYHGHFLNFLTEYVTGNVLEGAPRHSYDGTERFRDWGMRTFGISEDEWHDIKLAYRQGAQKRSAPIFYGAAELCDLVQRRGGELWVATTRPYMRLDNVDPDTRAWLERHGIKYDGLLYDKSKYERLPHLIDRARVVAALEDLPYQVENAKKEFGSDIPIYRRSHYNRGVEVPGVVSVQSLGEAMEIIEERILAWKERHEA